MGFKETFLGDGDRYNYRQMCVPQLPWRKSNAKLNFYAKGKWKEKEKKTNNGPMQVSVDPHFRLVSGRIMM